MTNIDRAEAILTARHRKDQMEGDGAVGCFDAAAAAEELHAAGLLAPGPQIIRTRDELAALDPDALVAMNPITKGHATAYVWSADTALRVNLLWHAPLVVLVSGDHVRAARRALEADQ